MTDVLDLPFDQFQRYELVRALLDDVRSPGETYDVLDVGGRTALLRRFLTEDRIQLVDVDPSDADGLVLGSGARLPFADGSFDAVAAFDTLEHVPPALREAFVAECARVARRYVILAGPYDSPRVAEAEELLLDFLRRRLNWEHRYLKEHRVNGLPDREETTRGFEAAGARVESFGHGALDRWLALMAIELYVEHEELLRAIAPRIYRLYNEHLFASDHGDDVYRHAVVAAFDGAPMPSLERALAPAARVPAEATRAFLRAGFEFARYDALRDTYEPEIARIHGVVHSLEDDLGQHKQSLGAVEADLAESRKTIEDLTGALAREREAVGQVAADKDREFEALRELHEAGAQPIELGAADLDLARA
ncbi:MAG: class I SAM-dependent methyltransferase, partial [Planctomycetota bacterium]